MSFDTTLELPVLGQPGSFEQLGSVVELTRALQPDSQELSEIRQQGHSLRSTVRELYKMLLQELVKLSLQQFGQTSFSTDSALLHAQILGLDDLSKGLILARINQGLYDWSTGQLSPELVTIKNNLTEYFVMKQLRTQIGEAGLFALDKFNLNDEQKAVAERLIDKNGVRQRVFNYQITPTALPDLAKSAGTYAQVRGGERERIEFHNLNYINQHFEEMEFGDTLVERSLPVYAWQHDCMWRFWHKTFTVDANGELHACLDVTILSLPVEPDAVANYPKLLNGVELIPTVNATDPLSQLLYIPAVSNLTVDDLVSQIPTVVNVGGSKTLVETDVLIQQQVQVVLAKLTPMVDHVVSQLPHITDARALDDLSRYYRQSVAVCLLEQQPMSNFVDLDEDMLDYINSGDLAEAVLQGMDLDDYIMNNVEGGYLEFDSECGSIVIGHVPEAEVQIDTSVAEVVDSSGGADITWVQTTDGRKMLKNCPNPNCSHELLDPCLSYCPSCKISVQGMYEAHQQRQLGEYIADFASRNAPWRVPTGVSPLDNFFNGVFQGFTNIFGLLFR